MVFSDLTLIPPLLRAVDEAGYREPSPIQEKAIPPVLAGRDLLGCAQTGTGKTAAFALPILQLLASRQPTGRGRPIRTLVLTPTRELALQIQESFDLYGKHMKLRSAVVFGGVNQGPQVAQLKRGVDILVATPGRLNDLIGQGFIKLGDLEIFVLDEADRMLDMGFVQDVKKIIRQIPEKRQTLLFSATMPKEIVELADSLLMTPKKIFVTPPSTTVEKIEQHLYKVDKNNKRHLLAKLLQDRAIESALVFTRTKHGADRVVRELKREGVEALAIHGNKSQGARQTALSSFKEGKVRVLVATDIAARGLDINELSHVINYDLPNIPETYVHRIGRTGRAGNTGIAFSFCNYDELPFLTDIEKLIGFAVPEETGHDWPMAVFESAPKAANGQGNTANARDKNQGSRPQKNAARPAQRPQKNEPKRPQKAVPPVPVLAQPTPSAQKKESGPRADRAEKMASEKSAPAPKRNQPAQKQRGNFRREPENPYENRTGGAAIITKRPVWSNLPQASEPSPGKGDEDMSRNNRRHRSGKKPGGQAQGTPSENRAEPAPRQDTRSKPQTQKNEKGVFDFSEAELAEDTALRLITGETARGEAKYANFEDFLKDH